MQCGLLGVSSLDGTHEVAEFELAVRPEREQLASRGVGEFELQRSLAPLRWRKGGRKHHCAETKVVLAVIVRAELRESGLQLVEPVVRDGVGSIHVLLDAGSEVLHRLVDLGGEGQERADEQTANARRPFGVMLDCVQCAEG